MKLIRSMRPVLLFTALLLIAVVVLEHVNGRFWLNDLRVYYMAADALWNGAPVYGSVFGEDTGLYKYAPSVLLFFFPYLPFSFGTAALLHFAVMGLQVMAVLVLIERLLRTQVFDRELPRPNLRAGLSLLFVAVLLVRELHMGNINLGLLVLVLAGTLFGGHRRDALAGIFFGAAWFLKPYLLLLIVPYVMRGRWELLRSAGATMLVGLALPLLYPGPAEWWPLHAAWVHSMIHHTAVLESPDTFAHWLQQAAGAPLPTAVRLLPIMLAGLALAWIGRRNALQHKNDVGLLAMEVLCAFAIVPNLVITDQQHFMFSWPLIGVVLAYLFLRKDALLTALFAVAMFGYATRSTDLWGGAMEDRLVWCGILGMGNILLIGVAIAAFWRARSLPQLRQQSAEGQ